MDNKTLFTQEEMETVQEAGRLGRMGLPIPSELFFKYNDAVSRVLLECLKYNHYLLDKVEAYEYLAEVN